MKKIILLLVLNALFSFVPAKHAGRQAKPTAAAASDTGGCQVVELFTSEGCSSCPAADKLLESLSQTYQHKVVVLGFHVDYWNRLGWKDRFSNPSYSDRQRKYAATIPKGEVYTPQAIVNGTAQMVGSDEKMLVQAINNALPVKQPVHLTASAKMNNGAVDVYCDFPAGIDHQLNIAVVLANADTQVKEGENKGRALHHVAIVRAFATVTDPLAFASLALPEKGVAKDYRVVVFVQDRKTMRIIASTDYIPVQ